MFFDFIWTETMRELMPWAGPFFLYVTELGGSNIYLAIILIGFWAVKKRETIVFALLVLFSGMLNYWLKGAFSNPRPPETDWLEGASASGYSLPSGHAQSATTFYGWLGIKIKTWWMAIISLALIVLIGLSRVYIGVHWMGDVLLGWAVGAILILFVWRFQEPVQSYLSKYSRDLLYLLLVVFGIVVTILTELIIHVPDDNFGANGGLLVGLAIGLWLEGKYVNFSTESSNNLHLALRVIIGLVLVFLLMNGLALFLPTDIYWLRMIRYALVAIVGAFIWPLIFERIHL
jgi:membrane-associated phospholipid phosphatase